jgi:serine/threonine protein kinase
MSPAGQAAEDLLGTVLESAYRIERLVGEGGMGAVYAPEPKTETSHRVREVKPAKRKPPPAKKDRSRENQDRWRIDE